MKIFGLFMLSVLAIAGCARGQSARLPPLYSSKKIDNLELYKFDKLRLSSTGKYIVAWNNGDDYFLSKTCADCSAIDGSSFANFHIFSAMRAYRFASGDSKITFLSSNGVLQHFDLDNGRSVLDGLNPTWVRVGSQREVEPRLRMSPYFDIYSDIDNTGELSSAGSFIDSAAKYHAGNIGFNSRDVYGVISGTTFFYLSRDDEFNMHIHSNIVSDKIIDQNGNDYYQQYANLNFKLDGDRACVLAAGSIICFDLDGAHMANLAKGTFLDAFIDGDEADKYYGFFSHSGIYPEHTSEGMRSLLAGANAHVAGKFLSGVSINDRSGAAIVSVADGLYGLSRFDYKNPMTTPKLAYRHLFIQKGHVTESLAADVDMPVEYKSISTNEGLHVDRYFVHGNLSTIIYFHGGPNTEEDLATSDVLKYFLASGFNVDVICYPGALYSYELATELNVHGVESIRETAFKVEKYLNEYHKADRIELLMISYGGHFYRFFDAGTLSRFHSVVLDEPAGTLNQNLNTDSRLLYAMHKKIYGINNLKSGFDNAFYENLATCQIKTRALLVYGDQDQAVNPSYDYRNCSGNSQPEVFKFHGEHGGSILKAFPRIVDYMRSN